MNGNAKLRNSNPPWPEEGAISGSAEQRSSEWDIVAEASWESFPASDSPSWIGAARPDRPLATPVKQ